MTEWRTGYHLTPLHNLESITTYGLQPYDLNKGSGWPSRGIWVWKDCGSGALDEAGCVIQRMIDHQATRVVLLRVGWRKDWEWMDGEFNITHVGRFYGNKGVEWVYHEGRSACIVTVPIPFDLIKVEKFYNLTNLVNQYD